MPYGYFLVHDVVISTSRPFSIIMHNHDGRTEQYRSTLASVAQFLTVDFLARCYDPHTRRPLLHHSTINGGFNVHDVAITTLWWILTVDSVLTMTRGDVVITTS